MLIMQVRLYQMQRSAMQAGRAKVGAWAIQPILPTARRPDPLMGWTSSRDTLSEIKMRFATREEAAAFAAKQGWQVVEEPVHERIVRPRNYVDNFKPWITEKSGNN